MIVKKASRPTKCKLCLQNAEEEIQRHLRENKPCEQPGCPLRNDINAALEKKRNGTKTKIVFGTPRKRSVYQSGGAPVRFSERSHTKESKIKKIKNYIINHFKKLKKL